MIPDPGVDFEVNIDAWADGVSTDQIRQVNNTHATLYNDLFLLYSPMKLAGLESFPMPRRFHAPRNDTAVTAQQDKLINHVSI